MARLGSRRFEGVREVAGGERRSWIVVSRTEDGNERRDVLNACSAEEAARMAARSGFGEVVRVEPREPCA